MRTPFVFVVPLVSAALVGCMASLAGQEPRIPSEKKQIAFEAMLGTVTFMHAKHARLDAVTCRTCHHQTAAGTTPTACSPCHGKSTTPARQDALHSSCGGCHDATEGKTGPTSTDCLGCHVK